VQSFHLVFPIPTNPYDGLLGATSEPSRSLTNGRQHAEDGPPPLGRKSPWMGAEERGRECVLAAVSSRDYALSIPKLSDFTDDRTLPKAETRY